MNPGEYGLLVSGTWAAASDGSVVEIVDPSSGATVGRCASASRRDVRRALAAAAGCVDEGHWAGRTQAGRSDAIAAGLDALDAEALAVLTARETGTPITTARLEVAGAIEGARWLLDAAGSGVTAVPTDTGDAYSVAARAPQGVVAVIAATLTPLRDTLWRIVPALAAGNAVVVTTSAGAPCAVIEACRRLASALPREVIHVVAPGSSIVWDELASSTFTSVVTAAGPRGMLSRIASLAAERLVPCYLRDDEPSAAVVLDDADLDTTAAALIAGVARHAGQTHHACARVAVPAELADPLLDLLSSRSAMLRSGPTEDERTEMGPLLGEEDVARTRRAIDRARAAGAGIRAGGHTLSDDGLRNGHHHAATIVAGDVPDPWGPVIGVVPSDDIPGRASRVAIFTADAQRALPWAQRAGVSAIWVNGHPDEDARISTWGRAGSGHGVVTGSEGALEWAVPVSVRLR